MFGLSSAYNQQTEENSFGEPCKHQAIALNSKLYLNWEQMYDPVILTIISNQNKMQTLARQKTERKKTKMISVIQCHLISH